MCILGLYGLGNCIWLHWRSNKNLMANGSAESLMGCAHRVMRDIKIHNGRKLEKSRYLNN
jgi:hypothetical protein